MDINKFIGTWRLISFTSILGNGQTIYLYGNKPVGYISYSPDGYVQVSMMHENFSQHNKQVSVENYLSYGGRFEINGDMVTHHMDVASVPAWAGGKQDRAYQFLADGKLQLSTVDTIVINGVTYLESNLVWEKV